MIDDSAVVIIKDQDVYNHNLSNEGREGGGGGKKKKNPKFKINPKVLWIMMM